MLKRRIKEKMQSEQGTSIFFGLLLFLTASILSVVILEGAVTTVKTVASDRTSEQNQLACTSAAFKRFYCECEAVSRYSRDKNR